MRKLSELLPGEEGVIGSLLGPESVTHHLLTLALLPGTTVKLLGRAPLGDPLMVYCAQTRISLRRSDAEQVELLQ